MSKRSRRRRLAAFGAIVVAVSVSVPVSVCLADQTLSPEELLRRADVGALAPESFRSRMRLTAGDKPPLEVEVWRKGESRTLVRLLGPKESGKYLLRLGSVLWFLAPGAKKPVRLSPSYRLRGSATLDDVLGLQYARDYKMASATDIEDGLVALDLTARGPGAIYPAVRYVVRRSTLRPVRAEYRLPSGKVATTARRRDDRRRRPGGRGAARARGPVRPRGSRRAAPAGGVRRGIEVAARLHTSRASSAAVC